MDKFDEITGGTIGPFLSLHDFKRSGNNWNRVRGGLVDVIGIQRNGRGDFGGEEFSLNIGTVIPAVFEIQWERMREEVSEEPFSLLRCRAGDILLEGGREMWWSCGARSNVAEVAEELRTWALPKVLEYFDSLVTPEDVHQQCKARQTYCDHVLMYKLGHALLAYLVDDRVEFETLMDELRVHEDEDWQAKLARVESMLYSLN